MTDQTFDQYPEGLWVTAVQAATVWTSPSSPRAIDQPGISNPADIDNWLRQLTHQEAVALSDDNRIQTQTLYGEAVMVTETHADWAHVVVPAQPSVKDERGYPGWIPLRQLTNVAKRDWHRSKSAAVIADRVWLENDNGEQTLELSFMTILPVAEEEKSRVQVLTPHGRRFLPRETVRVFSSDEGLSQQTGQQLLTDGRRFLGLGYFWGGMSSFGYDCSGLTYALHQASGYQIPRDARDQAQKGKPISYNALQPGDLLFFAADTGSGPISHVGLYDCDGQMLHSPQSGRGIERIKLAGTSYEDRLCAARRYWRSEEERIS
ncbi:gamma-D-glutamyl-L-lysine dipeptidyl-peptidase [Barrientosiimonas marina]|uniref:NlpC/P60 family protein n=1 Tax=Lentibacillus kimchii TaxID=1542911 RepID=A0ABW2UX73_9BACI